MPSKSLYSLSRLMFSVNLDGKQKKVKVRLRVDADIHAKKINAALCERGSVNTLAFIRL